MRGARILLLLAIVNGGWMIFDGIHVLLHGRYFGPERAGPWADLVSTAGLDPYALGIPFIILGGAWIGGFTLWLRGVRYAWVSCLAIACLTLWYIPVGSLFAVTAIGLLLWSRNRNDQGSGPAL